MTVATYLNALGLVNPLGLGKHDTSEGLFNGRTGIGSQTGWLADRSVYVGAVTAALPEVPPELSLYNSRNNRLLLAALLEIATEISAAISVYGPDRVAVILGTSTSGIADNEPGILEKIATGKFPKGFEYDRQDNASLAFFTRAYFGLTGPAMTISTACTSSAKTLASAYRMITAGICDAAIVGGADSLCKLTLNGFGSLDLLSASHCNPFSRNRDGINIGEGAAVFLMSRQAGDIRFAGFGETSDAYHISTPDPTGTGATNAIGQALQSSKIKTADIAYLNLHGTATTLNDKMEATAVANMLGDVPCSSTKPMTGHTLGAAGGMELGFLWLALQEKFSKGRLPPHIWDCERDTTLPYINLCTPGTGIDKNLKAMMTNSFAFGGNNISIILTKE